MHRGLQSACYVCFCLSVFKLVYRGKLKKNTHTSSNTHACPYTNTYTLHTLAWTEKNWFLTWPYQAADTHTQTLIVTLWMFAKNMQSELSNCAITYTHQLWTIILHTCFDTNMNTDKFQILVHVHEKRTVLDHYCIMVFHWRYLWLLCIHICLVHPVYILICMAISNTPTHTQNHFVVVFRFLSVICKTWFNLTLNDKV